MCLSVVLFGKSEGVSLDREIVLDNTEREKRDEFLLESGGNYILGLILNFSEILVSNRSRDKFCAGLYKQLDTKLQDSSDWKYSQLWPPSPSTWRQKPWLPRSKWRSCLTWVPLCPSGWIWRST